MFSFSDSKWWSLPPVIPLITLLDHLKCLKIQPVKWLHCGLVPLLLGIGENTAQMCMWYDNIIYNFPGHCLGWHQEKPIYLGKMKKKIQPEGNVLGHSAIQDNKSGLKSFSLKKQGEDCFHLISNWQLFFPCTKQSINLMQCEVYFLWKQLLSNIHCIYSLDQTHSKICN